jgi:cellulose synthase/poly-beta-1,6-N-acetylglucosamine synthase-like glycosyltransferase
MSLSPDRQSAPPHCSVIVPAYNAASTLEACIQSLLALDYPPDRLEIIAVDNGSRDQTGAILERYRDRILVTHDVRRGAAAARNAGLRRAANAVVAFTDADCVADRAWLSTLVRALDDPQVGIAGGAIRALSPVNGVAAFNEEVHDHRMAIEVFKPAYAQTANWASPRALLERLGGFDVSFRRYEDVDLAFRVQQAGFSLAYVPDAIVQHRNKTTLLALFGEGLRHGIYAVPMIKSHRGFLVGYGHSRIKPRTYARLGATCIRALRGPDRTRTTCDAVFNAGKLLGKGIGSVRYRYLDL